MPRNGSGVFTRSMGSYSGSAAWQDQRNATKKIFASDHDAHDQDIADAMTASLARDGQTLPTANLPMGGFRHTGVGDATARGQYATVNGVQDDDYAWGGTSSGGANTFVVTISPFADALAAGQRVRFISHQANTGASTLQVNALTATAIRRGNASGTALRSAEIPSGSIVECVYDGSVWRLLLPKQGVRTTWTPTIVTFGSTMTVTMGTIRHAVWERADSGFSFSLDLDVATSGTADGLFLLSIPITVEFSSLFLFSHESTVGIPVLGQGEVDTGEAFLRCTTASGSGTFVSPSALTRVRASGRIYAS